MNWFRRARVAARGGRRGRAPSRRARPELQALESRTVLYSATGNAWLNPEVVTISFMPDGTDLGGVSSNLFSAFESRPALAGRWQAEILRAAQVWAQQTNLNFVVVPDDGAPVGSGAYQQGSPSHGDIRIGGYNFTSSTLAVANLPPPVNNFSIAGDITFNTGQAFNVGTTYDLFTVAAHEFGHALGLGESSATSAAVMFPSYTGRKLGLAADDVAGIRSIYSGGSPRAPDAFHGNAGLGTAADLTGWVDPATRRALLPGLDLTAAGQSDYFSVTAPAGSGGTMKVAVQSRGLSLLAPRMTVYSAGGTVLAIASGAGQYGTRVTVNVSGVVPGQSYYVQVQGAEASAFGTGRYALGLSFDGSEPPSPSSPVVAYPNGAPLSAGGGMADQAGGYAGAAPVILGISPDTGPSASDGVTSAARVAVRGIAPEGVTVRVSLDGVTLGTAIADDSGAWAFDATGVALAPGLHRFTAEAVDPIGTVSEPSLPYAVRVDRAAPAPPVIGGVASDLARGGLGAITATRTPTFYGTSEPGATVTLYAGAGPMGAAVADRNGNWNFTVPAGALGLGVYDITARAADLAGNVGAPTASYHLVVLAPETAPGPAVADRVVTGVAVAAVGLHAPGGDASSVAPPLTISGRADALSRVAVLLDGVIVGVAGVDLFGRWSLTVPTIAPGTHRLSFRVYDLFGNAGPDSGALLIRV